MAASRVTIVCRKRLSRREGVELNTVEYWPAGDSSLRGCVLFHHGLAEHCGRYAHVGTRYAEAGVAFCSYDAVNHGRSDSRHQADRGFIEDFTHLVDDLCDYANEVHKTMAGRSLALPMFLHGHSMGGLVCSYAALRNQGMWAGLVLNSPLMGVDGGVVLRVQAQLGALLAALFPRAKLIPAAPPKYMSQDPEVVRGYIEDPLIVHGNVRSKTAYSMLKAFNGLPERYAAIELPVLAIHGNADTVCSLQAVKRFVEGISSKDKRLSVFQGGWHEMVHGPEKEKLMNEVLEWVDAHSARRSLL